MPVAGPLTKRLGTKPEYPEKNPSRQHTPPTPHQYHSSLSGSNPPPPTLRIVPLCLNTLAVNQLSYCLSTHRTDHLKERPGPFGLQYCSPWQTAPDITVFTWRSSSGWYQSFALALGARGWRLSATTSHIKPVDFSSADTTQTTISVGFWTQWFGFNKVLKWRSAVSRTKGNAFFFFLIDSGFSHFSSCLLKISQYPLLALSVHRPQMVWECVCVCVCMQAGTHACMCACVLA